MYGLLRTEGSNPSSSVPSANVTITPRVNTSTMFRSKTIPGTLLTLTAAAISVNLSFGPSGRAYQVGYALAVALLVACPVLHLRRERRKLEAMSPDEATSWVSTVYGGPTDTAVAVTLAVATLSLALLLLSPSRWPAAIAFSLAFVVSNLLIAPRKPVRSLFVALAATLCLWPVDDHLTSRFENRLSVYLARLASDRLDSHSVLNVPQGRSIRTLGGLVDIGMSDGRLPGLRLGAILGAALAVYLKRNMFHVLLMTASGWFWAATLSGFHYYGVASKQNSGGFLENLWAYPIFVLCIGIVLLVSTDQLWLVLGIFNPFAWFARDRKRTARNQEASSLETGSVSVAAEEVPEPRVLPGAVFVGIGAVALIVAFLDAGLTLSHRNTDAKLESAWQSVATSSDRGFFPDRSGRWAKTEQKSLMDTLISSRDAQIVNSYYASGDNLARVAFLGTYSGWYDRYQDFQLAGWNSRSQRVVNDSNLGLSYVINEFTRPTGEHCTLIYQISALDDRENGLLPASVRSLQESLLWEFFQSMFFRKPWQKEYYVTEVVLESFGPLAPAESQLLDELVRMAFDLKLPAKLRSND